MADLGTCGVCDTLHAKCSRQDWHVPLTPSADLPACRDEDPAWTAAAYPDPPEYAHPEEPRDD